MPSVASVKKDLEVLGTTGWEQILNYLEEIIIFASFVTEISNEVKENRFSKGKVCPHCGYEQLSRNGKFNGKLKEWTYSFHSVATKYLANYIYWLKWLQFFNTEKDTVKTKHLLVQSHTSHSDTKLKYFKIREAIYI